MRIPEERKADSERYLKSRGVPINAHLPMVEDASEARLRNAGDVARRVIVLYGLAALGHGIDRSQILEGLSQSGVWNDLSPSERAFANADTVTDQQRIDATWHAEAIWVLLWALGRVEELPFPDRLCDMDRVHSLIPNPQAAEDFIATAKLRAIEEILDETDRIYRIHWAVRDAQLMRLPTPASLEAGVVKERHLALNWLTWYADEWDEVTTDT